MKVEDVYGFLNEIAPFDTAAEWDNCGLSVGSFDDEVKRIYIALDVTTEGINEAKTLGADLFVTHHPLIFDPVKTVEKGTVLYNAVASGLNFISSHTCLDIAEKGVNYCLARALGIENTKVSNKDVFLNQGTVKPLSCKAFAEKIKDALGGAVAYNETEKMLSQIAFCSGSGGDLIALAKAEGADALVTGEAKHHEFLLARELNIALFAAGHYETENPVCDYLFDALNERFGGEIEIIKSTAGAPVKYI